MEIKAEYTVAVVGKDTFTIAVVRKDTFVTSMCHTPKSTASTISRLCGIWARDSTYTVFAYSEVRLSRSVVNSSSEGIVVSVHVKNAGSVAGNERVEAAQEVNQD
ncbi:hypothetical protein PI126_g24447 [Phytophthora idaei]|nr:hypothetical protein PI126_g24447 [Phytophthora idaei]